MTTDTSELTTNVITDSITNSTRTGKSTVAVEVTSVAAFSDVNENNDKATSATRSSASPATAEGQEVTEARVPDPSSTVVGTWSSSASTSLHNIPILNSLEANLTEEIKDSLILPKKQLSAQIRAKTSAPDARPSSVSAGVVAIAIISLVFFCLVVPDLLTLAQFLHGVLKADRRLTTM
ncbi:hypothetical protein C0Q70_03293 [Pomacea canaliculata]|uniref:Uncharacterized protein n=1 Tax=Pomacea canaliculata TaxID=400727 RepID=A0A2T7PSB8_POMCA|nr:hypothetical protein C0Q70_03293 [Pomacea canaliculata]